MRAVVLVALGLATVAAVGAADRSSSKPVRALGCGTMLALPPATRAGQQALFGHIASLRRDGRRFILRFDPSWHLSGYPAEEVMLRKTGSRDVPNDSIEVDETHQLLSFVVPASARVNVLRHVTCLTPSTAAALTKEFGKHHNGFWIVVRPQYPSPVVELDEQYHP